MRTILHSFSDLGAVFYKRSEHDIVRWSGEPSQRPTWVLPLLTWRCPVKLGQSQKIRSGCEMVLLHNTMKIGMQKAATKEGHGISKITDGISRDGLDVLPLFGVWWKYLKSALTVMEECLQND
jgi:hypothetical protein